MEIKITESDNVNLPGIGVVVGTVEYDPGMWATQWEPAEPAEVVCAMLTANGVLVDFDAMEDEAWDAAWSALDDAVGEIHDRIVSDEMRVFAYELAGEEYE